MALPSNLRSWLRKKTTVSGTEVTLAQALTAQSVSYKYSNGGGTSSLVVKDYTNGEPQRHVLYKAPDAAASTASDADYFTAAVAGRITAGNLNPHVALTANDTDYATIALKSGSTATITPITTKVTGGTGNWVAGTPITLTIADSAVAANDIINLTVTKSGAGVVVGPCSVEVQISPGAASTTYDDVVFTAPDAMTLKSVNFIPTAALTANDTNYATLSIKVSSTALASKTTKITGGSGDWTQDVPVALTVSSANIAAGDEVRFVIEKTAGGVLVPDGVIQLELQGGGVASTFDDVVFTADRACKILSACFIPTAALTANNTNYATLALKVSTTTKASVTTQITGSGDWTQDVPVSLTVSSATLAAGDELRFVITKTASGVLVPDGVVQIQLVDTAQQGY